MFIINKIHFIPIKYIKLFEKLKKKKKKKDSSNN